MTQRQPVLSIVWHPVSVLVALIGQVGGIWDRVRGIDLPADEPDEPVDGPPEYDPFGDLPDPAVDPARYGLPTV